LNTDNEINNNDNEIELNNDIELNEISQSDINNENRNDNRNKRYKQISMIERIVCCLMLMCGFLTVLNNSYTLGIFTGILLIIFIVIVIFK